MKIVWLSERHLAKAQLSRHHSEHIAPKIPKPNKTWMIKIFSLKGSEKKTHAFQ